MSCLVSCVSYEEEDTCHAWYRVWHATYPPSIYPPSIYPPESTWQQDVKPSPGVKERDT
jgi:hypothetical protein